MLKLNKAKYYLEESITNEPHHDKTNKMACAPSEDSDQPGQSLSDRIFTVRSKGS